MALVIVTLGRSGSASHAIGRPAPCVAAFWATKGDVARTTTATNSRAVYLTMPDLLVSEALPRPRRLRVSIRSGCLRRPYECKRRCEGQGRQNEPCVVGP